MKTKNEILTLVWQIVNNSTIVSLSGGVYKQTRPTDSQLEDCVISIISGNNAKFLQDGALLVKIFYQDIYANNAYYEDFARGQVLERLLFDLSETLLNTNGISFEVQSRETYTEGVPEIHQHYAILRINFKLTIHD